MLSWADARSIAIGSMRPPAARELPLSQAYGCRLAAPLRALVAVPSVDVAAMDGYAVCGSPPWRVVGRVLAGGAVHGGIAQGEAVEIATGAPVPPGASAVLPYESACAEGGMVTGVVEEGRHVRRRGEDVAEGVVVLDAGVSVTPMVQGLAAALGHDTLPVHPRPSVTVLVTGDEVVHVGVPPAGRVRDAIGPFLPGLVGWAGGRVERTVRLPDGARPLLHALVCDADVVVVCGASSKGPADHLRAVLDKLGAEVLIDGVAVRPGHPQLLARLPEGPLVVGLPGNPFAALGAAMTLLVPMLGRRETATGPLKGRVTSHPRDTRLVPVRNGVPVGHDRPGSLWGAALADALAVVPPGWRGGPVELIELPQGG